MHQHHLVGRLYQQRRHDGSLTYPVPVLAATVVLAASDSHFLEATPSGVAYRYLVPIDEEPQWPFARWAAATLA